MNTSSMAVVHPAEHLPATATPHLTTVCRHCAGSGREPAALSIEFSRSGDLRGEQQRMATETGISASMLSCIMSGDRAPSVLTLIRIARYCRTTVDRVLRIPAIWQRVHDQAPPE